MDTAWQMQLRQEAGELAAQLGLTGRAGEICSWHRWRRRVRRGWSFSGPAPGIRTDWLFACADGLLQVRADEPGPLVVGWDQLSHVEHRYDDEPPNELLGVTLAGLDGTRILFGRGYSDSRLFLSRLDRMAVMLRLPAALRQCRSGTGMQFADLTVSLAGIGWDASAGSRHSGPQFVPWSDIRSLAVRRDRLEIGTSGWRLPRVAYLSGLPDSLVVALLIQQLASEYPAIRQRSGPVEVPSTPGPVPWTRPVHGTWP
jgi:hypothetical protein